MIFQTSYPILGTKIRNIVQRKRILVLRSQIICGEISIIVSGDLDQSSVAGIEMGCKYHWRSNKRKSELKLLYGEHPVGGWECPAA